MQIRESSFKRINDLYFWIDLLFNIFKSWVLRHVRRDVCVDRQTVGSFYNEILALESDAFWIDQTHQCQLNWTKLVRPLLLRLRFSFLLFFFFCQLLIFFTLLVIKRNDKKRRRCVCFGVEKNVWHKKSIHTMCCLTTERRKLTEFT